MSAQFGILGALGLIFLTVIAYVRRHRRAGKVTTSTLLDQSSEGQMSDYGSNSGRTIEVMDDLACDQGKLEDELDCALERLINDASESYAEAVKREQEAWLRYRDARTTAIALSLGGSMGGIAASSAAVEITRLRILEINSDISRVNI